MQKARSRIQKSKRSTPSSGSSTKIGDGQLTKKVVNKVHTWGRSKRQEHQDSNLFMWVYRRWRLIVFLGFSTIATLFIIFLVHPVQISDWLLPQSYLPLLVCFGAATYAFSRLWLSRFHATTITLSIVFLLFIRLHALSLQTVFWYWFFGIILVCESIYFATQKLLVKKWFSDILRHSKVNNSKNRSVKHENSQSICPRWFH